MGINRRSSTNLLDDCLLTNNTSQQASVATPTATNNKSNHQNNQNLSHLTPNMTSSPVLFDPFDHYLYNTKKMKPTQSSSKQSTTRRSKSKSKNQSMDEQDILLDNETLLADKTNTSADTSSSHHHEFDMKRLRQLGLSSSNHQHNSKQSIDFDCSYTN